MSELIIYSATDSSEVQVRLEGETVWLTQEQMAEVFGRERSVISKHLRNIFKDEELDEKSNVQNLHIPNSDKPVKFYNLDVAILVGYRVNSKRGVQFSQWATRTLREHLTRGFTLDQQRFEKNAAELDAALVLVRKTAQAAAISADTGRGLADIVARYAQTFLWQRSFVLSEVEG